MRAYSAHVLGESFAQHTSAALAPAFAGEEEGRVDMTFHVGEPLGREGDACPSSRR